MRVLLTVSAWPTHYLSMVPVAWALQTTGHEVRVLCPPSQVDSLSRTGLPTTPLLAGLDVGVLNRLEYHREAVDGQWPYPWLPLHPLTGAELSTLDDFERDAFARDWLTPVAAEVAHGFDAAVEYARWWQPELILHDPMSFEGLLAARVTGVPAVLSLWGPVGTHEPAGPRLILDDLSGSFRRYGLGDFGRDLIENVIDPCPASLEPETTANRLPVRYVPCNLGGTVPWGLNAPARRPRIGVTWSTALTTMSGPKSYALPDIVRALSTLDVDVVLTATKEDVAALGDVPAAVRVLTHCPLQTLLPTCDAVVHHGGAGSTMTSVMSGIPQVIITYASEQARNAEKVALTGAGLHIPGAVATVDSIRAAVVDILRPRYEHAAATLRDEAWDRPTPAELVDALDKLARG